MRLLPPSEVRLEVLEVLVARESRNLDSKL